MLHDPTFHHQYRQFQQEPESVSLSWLALLFTVLATGVLALDSQNDILAELSRRSTASQKVAELTERYRSAAFRCLEADGYLWRQNLFTLQALIILVYGISHSHGQAWSLLGLTYHIALSVGCHVDPASFNLTPVEREERRRCWHGLKLLYMIQNTSLGLGSLYHLSQSSTRLPADVNDDEIELNTRSELHRPGIPSQMSYYLLKFRLYEIASSICSEVLKTQSPCEESIARLDKFIKLEQQKWKEIYRIHSQQQALPIHHTVHFNILYAHSHHFTLLLWRPLLFQSSKPEEIRQLSKSICTQSAKGILEIHDLFHNSVGFAPFHWYHRGLGSFHALHAAVTLAAISLNDYDPFILNETQIIIESTSKRFNDMTEASLICAKAVPVLRHLL
jgi:hypothetical protein